jgi:hypothetical protein
VTAESFPTKIANTINFKIFSALGRVPFIELVKAACYRPLLIIDLYNGLSTTRYKLW